MNKKIILPIAIIAIILLAILTANFSGLITLNNSNEYVIGSIMPLSGDAAAFGLPFEKTVNLAVNEINENGGINGKQLKVIFEDSKCTNKDAVDSVNKLININNVKIIIGGICSGETLAAAPIAEKNKIILFSPASGSPDITFSGDYIFRNTASDAYSGKKIAEAIIKNNQRKLAIITENSDYALAISRVFKEEYKKLGGEILIEEKFNSDVTDFKTIVTKIINTNPDAIYLIPQTPKSLTILLKELKENNYTGQLYGNEYTRSKEVLEDYATEAEDIIFAEPEFNENSPLTKELLGKLKANNIDLSYPSYQTKVYDSVYIIKEAIEKCKTDRDTDCIKNHLYGIKDRLGTDGFLTINENGDAEVNYQLKIIKNGEVVIYNN
jgi:branched-chain amino acid transport system substrate-binding protein